MKGLLLSLLLLVASFFAANDLQAGVILKNGNYFMGYQDIYYPGGFEPKVLRVYNSKAVYNGWFGFGWGSDYEVHILEMADGSVIINENGGGDQTHFSSPGYDKKSVEKGVDAILAAMKLKVPMNAEQVKQNKNILMNDNIQRQKFAVLYGVKSSTPEGSVLTSQERGLMTLKKVKGGWIRTQSDGKEEHFNDLGKLVKIVDRNKNWLQLNYDKNFVLQNIRDNFNRQIDFKFNQFGKVVEVSIPGKKAEYKYEGVDLVYSKDIEGNTYTYTYSKDGKHLLNKITYSDKSTTVITYSPPYDLVTKIQDRDGTLTEYKYGENPQKPTENYWTEVSNKTKDGTLLTKAKYEYWVKKKIDGREFNYKMKSDIDGEITITDYNESSLPIKIEKNNRITSFKYYQDGLLEEKDTPFENLKLVYDPKWKKVSKVTKSSKTNKKDKPAMSEYKYDDKGNLSSAVTSDNKKVALSYDTNGRIDTMIDQEGRKIQFKYNEFGKPTEIKDAKLGKIKVEYTSTGEIKKVNSDVEGEAGAKIAKQITSAFQNLLEILKPAGVTLSSN